ncbi:MAG: sulfatase-like hydrolase/transferase [Gemmatimonadales bacterium]
MTAWYPFLLAAARVLYQAWHNPGYYTVPDLLVVLVAVLAGVGLVYAVAAVLRPRDAGPRWPAFVALLAVLWVFGFPIVAGWLPRAGHRSAQIALAVVGVLASGLALVWVRRKPRVLATVSTFCTLTGALLVLRFGAAVALDRAHAARLVRRSALAEALARPIRAPAVPPAPARDVYLIVLDEYANARVLRDMLGFDNGPFLDSLRALGFVVPEVRSNYMHTMLSLPSMLNAAHLQPLEAELGAAEKDPTLPNELLAHNRVARFLKSRGYRYIFFPSYWWISTHTSPIADSVVDVWDGVNLDRELGHSEFRRTLRAASLIDALHRDEPWDGDFVRRTLAGVARLPIIRAPVFAFAHVLSPHSPYAFDRRCRTPERYVVGRRLRDLYVDQLECLNHMVLATVTRLIRDSDVPPIILLQGDHGSAVRGFRWDHRLADISPLEARERFGAFGAYYLPGGGAAAFGDTVTVVNVLGNILRHYFGAELPKEPDAQYMSVEDAPFDFQRPDPAWLAGQAGEAHDTQAATPAR